MIKPNFLRREEIILWLQKMFVFGTTRDLFWEIKRLLFTKERMEIGIFRFLILFSKIWRIGERYKAERIGERADS